MPDFSGLEVSFRPISSWPGESTRNRRSSPFRARWSDTLELLKREIGMIRQRGTPVVLEVALREQDIRLDGFPRANARPAHPGVILNVESKWGPLRYPCDTFPSWDDNLRAIALALEALRKVDRYGVTKRGEQYAGWKALPGAGASTPTMSAAAAAEFMSAACGGDCSARALLQSRANIRPAYLHGARRLHPDAGGSTEEFQRLQLAKDVLERHHGGGA